jgi:hypothetical protein
MLTSMLAVMLGNLSGPSVSGTCTTLHPERSDETWGLAVRFLIVLA